jgi:hypothetical protein
MVAKMTAAGIAPAHAALLIMTGDPIPAGKAFLRPR